MYKTRTPNKAELLLGETIHNLRLKNELTRLQLGKKINKKEQQIAKYENGEFIPLSVLEDIGDALGTPVAKKLIRKISTLRKLEIATGIEQEGLCELYEEAFSDDDLYQIS